MNDLAAQLSDLAARATAQVAVHTGERRELARAIVADAAVIGAYADNPVVGRALSILWANLEALQLLERQGARVVRTDAEVCAAVATFGGIRAAARNLRINASSVSRRLRRSKLLRATPQSLVTPIAYAQAPGYRCSCGSVVEGAENV